MKNYSAIVLAFGVTQVSNISFLSSEYHLFFPPFVYFCFYFFCLKKLTQENTAITYISILPMFSSLNFMASIITFRF